MNDSPPTPPNTPHDTQRDSPPTFSVVEVASILGISKDAVRARLHRGSLEGEKIEGAWRIRLPDDVPLATVEGVDRQGPTPHTTAPTPDTTLNATAPQSDMMIDHLRDEVAYLRSRLDWAQSNVDAKDRLLSDVLADLARQRERTDVLQAQYHQASERIQQLEAGESKESEDTLSQTIKPPQSAAADGHAETYRAPSSSSSAGFLDRLRRWLAGDR